MHGNFLMRNMRETGQPGSCPRATQDLDFNLDNRQDALDTKMYGPANPAVLAAIRRQVQRLDSKRNADALWKLFVL